MKKRPAAPNRTLDRSSVSDSDVNEEIFFKSSSGFFPVQVFLTGKEVRVKKSQLELQLSGSRVSGFGAARSKNGPTPTIPISADRKSFPGEVVFDQSFEKFRDLSDCFLQVSLTCLSRLAIVLFRLGVSCRCRCR